MDKFCPTVSVIVPGYNESHLTSKVLTDIIRTADLDYECIFVDDGSTDDTAGVVHNFKEVKYLKHEVNMGVPVAWNTGIKECKGDYVIILNNDIEIVDRNWMSKMVNVMRGRNVIVGAEKVDFNTATTWNNRIMPYINGWCFGMPRRAFYELGLFDERFTPGGMEDVDFCVRAELAGYELIAIDLRIQHMYAATRGKYQRNEMNSIAERNRSYWVEKMNNMTELFVKKKIVFDCNGNMQGGWGPYDLEQRGLGGAETAFTILTRELAKRGHEVVIFNDVTKPIEDDIVKYYPRSQIIERGLDSDVFVLFRCPSEYVQMSIAKKKIFWSCDQHTQGKWDSDIFPYVDEIVCISDYHADYLGNKFIASKNKINNINVIGCPIQHWNYEPHIAKNDAQFLFCSVPHRGLEYMPVVMNHIRKALPEAKLIITSDYRLWGAPEPRNDEFKPMFRNVNDIFLGKVPRADLIRYQLESVAQPYPCTYEECFCIAVAECSAAGAVPVTTDIGAVSQTVGHSGFIVGQPVKDFALKVAQQTLDVYGNLDIMRQSVEQSWRWSAVNIANQWCDLFIGEGDHKAIDFMSILPGKRIMPDGSIISMVGNS